MPAWAASAWESGAWASGSWVGMGSAVSASAAGKPKRKREILGDIKEASRLALLRRRRRELLQAERERSQEVSTPEPAQAAQKRLFTVDKELQRIHDEIVALNTHIETKRKKRRERDKMVVLLLID